MIVARTPVQVVRDPRSVVTVGTFDGVHAAHQEIIREVVRRARDAGGRSVVVTFEPHPKEVVASDRGAVRLLSSMDERIELFETLGVDLVFVVQFTYAFSRMSSRDFYEGTVVREVGVSAVVVGFDHMFGRDREAGIRELEAMGGELGFTVVAVPPFLVNGERVSSTLIRRALAAGEIQRATALLGRPYTLTGRVVAGDRRGRTLGYPTANIVPVPANKVVPGHGIYVVRVRCGEFTGFGMLSIGVRPTIGAELKETIEVNILDFAQDIYGALVTVEVLRKLRNEERFPSLDALVRQMDKDKAATEAFIRDFTGATRHTHEP